MVDPSKYQFFTVAEAISLQHELSKQIDIRSSDLKIHCIAGADISFDKNSEIIYAGIIVLSYPDLKELERVTVISKTVFPYIPGLLAFREVPALLEALAKLKHKPDVMILDGQGITHERKTGIATHFGLLTDIPSIGCAKSSLWGKYMEPQNQALAHSPIYAGTELLGYALRSKKNCKPIFISPGHRVTVSESLRIMMSCIRNHRIPEPTRIAHLLVNLARIMEKPQGSQLRLF